MNVDLGDALRLQRPLPDNTRRIMDGLQGDRKRLIRFHALVRFRDDAPKPASVTQRSAP